MRFDFFFGIGLLVFGGFFLLGNIFLLRLVPAIFGAVVVGLGIKLLTDYKQKRHGKKDN